MIRVLHVLNELRVSGAEVMLRTAAGIWPQHDVQCDIVSTGTEKGPFYSELETAGYALHHVPFTGDLAFLKSYGQVVRSGEYDVVHVHTERASVYLSITAQLVGARVVRTLHNSFPFEGRLARRRALQRRITRATGTRFVAIGDTVAQNELQRFSNPTVRIDNWIDVDRFTPPTEADRAKARNQYNVPPDSMTLVTVGNCSATKNHETLLRALADIRGRPWTWLHVGEEDDLRSEETLARDLGIQDSCRFLGRTDPLGALYAADLFAMPSLYEGVGLSTVEALATGLPVILTDVPGNRDLRALAHSPVWSTPEVNSLRQALLAAISNDLQTRSASDKQAQHAEVRSRFSPRAGVSAYSELYASILRK